MAQFNKQKAKALVHYVCASCERASLGAVKLRKVLWFSDVFAFQEWGESITGDTYIKLEFGPVPRHATDLLRELKEEGALVERVVDCGYPKREYISLRPPDLALLDSREIALVAKVAEVICEKHTAKSISEFSHDEVWDIARIGEEIPLEATLASELGELDEDDMAWAREQAERKAA